MWRAGGGAMVVLGWRIEGMLLAAEDGSGGCVQGRGWPIGNVRWTFKAAGIRIHHVSSERESNVLDLRVYRWRSAGSVSLLELHQEQLRAW